MKDKFYLCTNQDYLEQINTYCKYDAYCSFILYILLLVFSYFLGKTTLKYENLNMLSEYTMYMLTGAYSLTFIGLVFFFCYLRKQKANTIGFSRKFAFQSLATGFVFCFLVFIIWPNNMKYILKNLSILKIVYYFIFVAFFEELTFRAYIGSRIHGITKNPIIAFFVTALLFSISHIPYQAVIHKTSIITYIFNNSDKLFQYIFIAFIFQWLYTRYNSIIGPTILHFFWDFYRIQSWR